MCLDNEMQGQYQINKHVGVALSCLKLFLSYNCNEQKALEVIRLTSSEFSKLLESRNKFGMVDSFSLSMLSICSIRLMDSHCRLTYCCCLCMLCTPGIIIMSSTQTYKHQDGGDTLLAAFHWSFYNNIIKGTSFSQVLSIT